MCFESQLHHFAVFEFSSHASCDHAHSSGVGTLVVRATNIAFIWPQGGHLLAKSTE
jgi:hypothetical protein